MRTTYFNLLIAEQFNKNYRKLLISFKSLNNLLILFIYLLNVKFYLICSKNFDTQFTNNKFTTTNLFDNKV